MNRLKVLVITVIMAITGNALAASHTYQVYVDTHAIAGTSGYLDFQFNPGNDAQAAIAEILNFGTIGGSLTGTPDTVGEVTGSLPGVVTLGNSDAWNDYFQNFTYGDQIHFALQFDGPAVSSPNGFGGSDFAFSMFDTNLNPVLTGNPNGFAVTAAISPTGETSALYGSNTSPVPEPSTFALLGLGLAGAALLRTKTVRG